MGSYLVEGDKDDFQFERSPSGRLPKRCTATNLKVLIVGGGPAGLMTALECWRKGHNVIGILERANGPVYTGDVIIIGPSATNVFRHWPDMWRELDQTRKESSVYYRKHNGELILGPTSLGFNDPEYLAQREGVPVPAPHQVRREFYQILLRQVARVGLKVDYGQRIEKYFEDEAAGMGGVVTRDGTVRVAHVVVAADAGRTKSEVLIAGQEMPVRSSGMSVYRAAIPTELAMQNEAFRKRWGGMKEASHEFWIGPGMHLGLMVSPSFVAWGLTPRDNSIHSGGVQPNESWDPDVDPEVVIDVLRRVPGWDPAIEGLMSVTPKGTVVHWPLLWRNLRREWTSKGGRVVQVGDAAHSSIPASASGGTLAIEDAVTLAACLQLSCSGGDATGSGAPLGCRIYNLMRYERVSCSQKMSFVNAEILGGMKLEDIAQDPNKVRVRFPKWLFQHDPEAYVYEKYGQAFAHLMLGAKLENTNLPPGHRFQPWTIEQIQEDARNGKSVAELLDGDWS